MLLLASNASPIPLPFRPVTGPLPIGTATATDSGAVNRLPVLLKGGLKFLMQQFVESFKGCFPVQHFSGTAVEQLLNPFDLVVTDLAEVCAFGIELADEAIGVLVGAALPGAMRMREVDLDVRVLGKQPV